MIDPVPQVVVVGGALLRVAEYLRTKGMSPNVRRAGPLGRAGGPADVARYDTSWAELIILNLLSALLSGLMSVCMLSVMWQTCTPAPGPTWVVFLRQLSVRALDFLLRGFRIYPENLVIIRRIVLRRRH